MEGYVTFGAGAAGGRDKQESIARSALSFVLLAHQRSRFSNQTGELRLNDAPHNTIIDLCIGVSQYVSEPNDAAKICDSGSEGGVYMRKLRERFTDDRKGALDSKTQHWISLVVLKLLPAVNCETSVEAS